MMLYILQKTLILVFEGIFTQKTFQIALFLRISRDDYCVKTDMNFYLMTYFFIYKFFRFLLAFLPYPMLLLVFL